MIGAILAIILGNKYQGGGTGKTYGGYYTSSTQQGTYDQPQNLTQEQINDARDRGLYNPTYSGVTSSADRGFRWTGYDTRGTTVTATGFSAPLTYAGGSFGGITTIQGSGTVQAVTPKTGTPSNTTEDQPVSAGDYKRQQSGHAFHV